MVRGPWSMVWHYIKVLLPPLLACMLSTKLATVFCIDPCELLLAVSTVPITRVSLVLYAQFPFESSVSVGSFELSWLVLICLEAACGHLVQRLSTKMVPKMAVFIWVQYLWTK